MKTITSWIIAAGLLSLPLAPNSFAEQASDTTSDKTLESEQQNTDQKSSDSDQRRSRGTFPGLEQQGSSQDSGQPGDRSRTSEPLRSKSDADRSTDLKDTKTSEASKIPTKPGETDITNTKGEKGSVPNKYTIMPVARGKKVEVNNEMIGNTVQNPKGETLGSIEELIMDSETRRIEYAMMKIGDTDQLKAFPWSAFKVDKNSGNVVLNMTKEQLQPGLLANDQSPDLSNLERQLQSLRQQESHKGDRPGLGVTKQPAAGGPHGETEVGGAGPSGERALPPSEEAPQFKGGK